ncbi:MAG: thermonuclease family protein [Treponema sp.]|nr:thermonuclease family protein [Treponema sp.]
MKKFSIKKILKFSPVLILILIIFVISQLFAQDNNRIFCVNEHNIRVSTQVKTAWLIPAHVTRVVDGDTIIVIINEDIPDLQRRERVRLLGVDTPETVHPNREAQAYGQEASDYTKMMLEEKTVYLAFDWDLRDRFGRLLAYVYTGDGICHNAQLIKHGFGHAYTRYPFQFMEEFRNYEREARSSKTGLWGL